MTAIAQPFPPSVNTVGPSGYSLDPKDPQNPENYGRTCTTLIRSVNIS